VPWQIKKMYLMKLRNEGHERMLLGYGIDLKTTCDDDCVVIFPVSKVKYVDHYLPLRYLHQMHVYSLPDLFRTCSASESCRSVADGLVLPKLVSLAMRGRAKGMILGEKVIDAPG
jgi:hypothetical protein